MKNYASYSILITGIVIVALLVIGQFNPIKVGAYTLKDVDIFSDLRVEEESPLDTTLLKPKLDSCKAGMFCIEDYSPKKNALNRFLNALDSTKHKNIRVAFFGDSFIEGDILTEDVREGLQKEYGGRGVGFVPLSTVLAGARRSITINSNGIGSHWLVDSSVSRREAGIAGSYYYPSSGASVSYLASSYRQYIDTFSTVRVLYQNKGNASTLSYSINRSEKGSVSMSNAPQVGLAKFTGKIGRVSMNFSGSNLKLFGALLDDSTGVCVDNFAMRGNSGAAILNVPQSTLRATDSLLNYRLVVLQYGLNVTNGNEKKFDAYKKQMAKVIEHIKSSFPNADILLISVSDRSTLKAGKYVTMPCIPYLVNAQRIIAADAHIAFWDTYTAMGGENSMPNFVTAKPAKAAKDYTHLSFDGGKEIGGKLLEALLYEKKKHDEKKAH